MNYDKKAIIEECRSLTGYNEAILPPEELETLYQIAVSDIEGVVGEDLAEVENPAAGRAVFWSMALFAKIHMGEMEGLDFNIGSIKIHQLPRRDITRVWYRQLDQYLNALRSEASTGGLTTVSRNDREYPSGSNRELI